MEYHGAGSASESSGSVIVVAWDGVTEVDEDYNFSESYNTYQFNPPVGGILCLKSTSFSGNVD